MKNKSQLIAIVCTLLVPVAALADVELPSVFGDDMVLQRDMPIAVWGHADPGEAIAVRLGEHEIRTQADRRGIVACRPARAAGGRALHRHRCRP